VWTHEQSGWQDVLEWLQRYAVSVGMPAVLRRPPFSDHSRCEHCIVFHHRNALGAAVLIHLGQNLTRRDLLDNGTRAGAFVRRDAEGLLASFCKLELRLRESGTCGAAVAVTMEELVAVPEKVLSRLWTWLAGPHAPPLTLTPPTTAPYTFPDDSDMAALEGAWWLHSDMAATLAERAGLFADISSSPANSATARCGGMLLPAIPAVNNATGGRTINVNASADAFQADSEIAGMPLSEIYRFGGSFSASSPFRGALEFLHANRASFAQQNTYADWRTVAPLLKNRSGCPGDGKAWGGCLTLQERTEFYDAPRPVMGTRCGWFVPSEFDGVRARLGRRKCDVVMLTLINKCYDWPPMPLSHDIPGVSVCQVLLTDNATKIAVERFTENYTRVVAQENTTRHEEESMGLGWELFDMGPSLFRHQAKPVEHAKLIALRMFPRARWVIWIDGKSWALRVRSLKELLAATRAPYSGVAHPWWASIQTEFDNTKPYVAARGGNETVVELLEQLNVYREERPSFLTTNESAPWRMEDISFMVYRNHVPLVKRYLCAWVNDVNRFCHRGQISVIYTRRRAALPAQMFQVWSSFTGWSHRRLPGCP
jgi:hypothetical protein